MKHIVRVLLVLDDTYSGPPNPDHTYMTPDPEIYRIQNISLRGIGFISHA